jgi:hypothetical protein
MINITKDKVSEYVVSGSFDIPFSVKADESSKEKKSGTLRFKMSNTPVADIIASSLKDKRINEQVKMRAKFNSIVQGGIIEVNYEGGKLAIDPKEAFRSGYLACKTDAERTAFIAEWTGKQV